MNKVELIGRITTDPELRYTQSNKAYTRFTLAVNRGFKNEEGEPNFLYPASTTTLQQGHKDPSKPLTIDNTIPQCPFCNRASRNYFVFDNKGRVEKIYDPQFVLRSDKSIQIEMLKLLIEANMKYAKEYIENNNE